MALLIVANLLLQVEVFIIELYFPCTHRSEMCNRCHFKFLGRYHIII